jgi:DNA-binding transcriptional MocR family regulator
MSSSSGGSVAAEASRAQRAIALAAGGAAAVPAPAPAPAAAAAVEAPAQSLSGGFTTEIDEARTLFDGAKSGGVTALGPGAASADLLAESSAAMATAAAAALGATGSESLLQYGPVRGDGRYIRELSTFLTRRYAEPVDASHLTLTSGATSGCALVSSLFFTPGSNVFIEDPSYFLAVSMFKDYGMNMISVSSDGDGMRMESLETEIKIAEEAEKRGGTAGGAGRLASTGQFAGQYAGLVFVVPTFGNPTGATLTDARRKRLVTLARRHNLLVLADDVYQLLPFPGMTPPPRLVSYDLAMGASKPGAKCHVLSNGSFSKLIGPGVRLGWLEGGPGITEQLLSSGVLESSGSMNHLTSGIMAEVLRSGAQDRLLDVLRSTYAARAAALTDALRAALPEGATVTSTEGGFFCWLQLPEGVRAEAVIAAAMAHETFPVSALPGAWGNARPFHCAICFRRKTITCQDRLWTH